MTQLDPRTQRVIRDLAKTQHDLRRQVNRLNRGQDAGRTTIHHGALQVADDQGNVTHRLGEKGLAPVLGPVPPRPAAPVLTAGAAQIIVSTDGDDEHGETAPADWAKTRVYVTTQPPLTIGPAHAKGTIAEVTGETTIGVHAGVWHVGIVWVTESGQESELSEVATVEVDAPVDTEEMRQEIDQAREELEDATQQALEALSGRIFDDNGEELSPEFVEAAWVGMAVVKRLTALEAWIGGALLKDNAITVDKLTALDEILTEMLRARKIEAGDMNVNNIWADQTWQNAGYFGSESVDQQTLVDGTGVTLHRRIDDELVPAAMFGGGDVQLAFWDDENNPTGSITRDGHISGKEINAPSYKIAGRPLVGDTDTYPGQTPIIDTLPRGVIGYGARDMSSITVNRNRYGFLEISAPVEAGRVYTVETTQLRVDEEFVWVGAYFRYTIGTNPPAPTVNSPVLYEWTLRESTTRNAQIPGHYTFVADQSGIIRILLGVRFGGSAGRDIVFSSQPAIVLTLKDEGIAQDWTSLYRESGTGGSLPNDLDEQAAPRTYHTGWIDSWLGTYYHDGSRYTEPHINIFQGRYGTTPTSLWHSHTGGYQTTPGFGGANSEAGRTIPQALAGATIVDGTLTIAGLANGTANQGTAKVYANTLTTRPTTSAGKPSENMLIAEVPISAGTETVIDLPQWVFDHIKAGTFGGFTYHPGDSQDPYITIRRSAPVRLRYQR